jgi:hypothetical protein
VETEKKVILAAGPLHLFWTTDIYYLWELSRIYSVILIADESYKNNPVIQRIVRDLKVPEVLYLPGRKNIFAKHRFYIRKFRELVERHKPVFVFQHNSVYIENIYLFRACGKSRRDCHRINYQTGISCIDWKTDFKLQAAYGVEALRNRYNVPAWCAHFLYNALNVVKKSMDYYIVPMVLTGRWFSPYLDIYTGKFRPRGDALRARLSRRYDLLLTYDHNERRNIAEVRGFDANVVQIKHPVQTVGDECHRLLYRSEEEPAVSIFPTYGFSSLLRIEKNISAPALEKSISDNWIAAIKILYEKFPGRRFLWKLHPAAEKNALLSAITERVKKELGYMTILPPDENAQELIVKSKVVVTDASAIFWWSSLQKSKTVIVLDVFNYPSFDYTKFQGVHYFDALDKLASFDFRAAAKETREKDTLPSLTDLVNSIMKNGIGASA